MRGLAVLGCLLVLSPFSSPAQDQPRPASVVEDAPLPEIRSLLEDVERNQRRFEAMQRDYTYHVRSERQNLDKNGGVKETETIDAESVTVDGLRVDRVVARNGKALTPEEQQKESERIDKEVAKAKERRNKAQSKGAETDSRGQAVVSLARILELGTFSNERRIELNGRSTLVLDYAGDPKAKTHSPFEAAFRSLAGTVWIDETDRVLVRGEGKFLSDFKLGGGLIADLRKGTTFSFRATRVNDSGWLPATVDGQGSVRVMLFANFNGRLHLTTSDYRRFRTSATILPGNGVIGADGQPVPEEPAANTASQGTSKSTQEPPQR